MLAIRRVGACAVKLMAHGKAGREAMRQEVELMRACDHPHVLPLWGGCDDLRAPCLVTPLMHGAPRASRVWGLTLTAA